MQFSPLFNFNSELCMISKTVEFTIAADQMAKVYNANIIIIGLDTRFGAGKRETFSVGID